MPPTFLYMMAFALWMSMAALIWLVAAFLFLVPRTRPLARSLSLAMAATFPGVLVFQIVAAPFALGILLLAWLVGRALDPGRPLVTENPVVIGVSIVAMLAILLLIAVMSSLGFYEGWREAINQGPSAKLVLLLKQRRRDKIFRS